MTAYAQRIHDPAGVDVWITDQQGRVLRGSSWDPPDEPNAYSAPSLRLDVRDAEHLWTELAQVLRLDISTPRSEQRADYLHERGRVDHLISVLATQLRSSSSC